MSLFLIVKFMVRFKHDCANTVRVKAGPVLIAAKTTKTSGKVGAGLC